MNRHRLLVAILCLMAVQPCSYAAGEARLFAWEIIVDSEDSTLVRIPTGVAAGSDSELAVIDADGNRMILFEFSGVEWTEKKTVNLAGTPNAVAHDGTRYLVSVRGVQGLMAVEGPRYTLRPVSLPPGAVAGAVAGISGGGFLVHDTAGHQVLNLTRGGKTERKTPVEAGVVGLAAASGGGFFVSLPVEGEILSYDATGKLSERWPVPPLEPVPAWPISMVQIEGDLLVLDRHGHRLVLFDSRNRVQGIGARRGWEPGLLLFPSGLAVFPDGRVAVADQMNGRVQIYKRIEEEQVR